MDLNELKSLIRDVPDFPKKGILFKDITTLLANPDAFKFIMDSWEDRYAAAGITAVVGIEARGFIFGAALAHRLGCRFIPARKPGKLPWKTIREQYDLEYGTDAIEIHEDALDKTDRIVIVDDLLATGGTAHATARLVERLGGKIHELAFVIELAFLNARMSKLADYSVFSLVSYSS